MSKTKHTPGPWQVKNQIRGSALTIQVGGLDIALAFSTLVSKGDVDSVTANARLIASAPDLLSALKQVLAHHGYTEAGPDFPDARAAIRKAEGQS